MKDFFIELDNNDPLFYGIVLIILIAIIYFDRKVKGNK